MGETIGILGSLFAAAGLGGVVGAYFQARFQHRATVGKQEHELKQRRYLCISILMLARIHPVVGLPRLRDTRPDISSETDLAEELRAELMNGMVYASAEVLLNLGLFISDPSVTHFVQATIAMRKDLWGRTSGIDEAWFKEIGVDVILRGDPSK